MRFPINLSLPPVGTDLPVCSIDSDQCCTVNYIESIQEKAQRRLEKFLRKEFEDVVENYQDEIDNLLECEFYHACIHLHLPIDS